MAASPKKEHALQKEGIVARNPSAEESADGAGETSALRPRVPPTPDHSADVDPDGPEEAPENDESDDSKLESNVSAWHVPQELRILTHP